jgi:hypothetical protein
MTYEEAQELVKRAKHCPNCGKKDTLVAVDEGEFPPGKHGIYWHARQPQVVCLDCCCVWTFEKGFFDTKKIRRAIEDDT